MSLGISLNETIGWFVRFHFAFPAFRTSQICGSVGFLLTEGSNSLYVRKATTCVESETRESSENEETIWSSFVFIPIHTQIHRTNFCVCVFLLKVSVGSKADLSLITEHVFSFFPGQAEATGGCSLFMFFA